MGWLPFVNISEMIAAGGYAGGFSLSDSTAAICLSLLELAANERMWLWPIGQPTDEQREQIEEWVALAQYELMEGIDLEMPTPIFGGFICIAEIMPTNTYNDITPANTWVDRYLEYLEYDYNSGVVQDGTDNQKWHVPAGTWLIEGLVHYGSVGRSISRAYFETSTLEAKSSVTKVNGDVGGGSYFNHVVTLPDDDTMVIQSSVQGAGPSGIARNWAGVNECYAQIRLTRLI